MGTLGAVVNLFVPGLTQLFHLKLGKFLFIWLGFGFLHFALGFVPVIGGILTTSILPVPILGTLSIAEMAFHFWQIKDAYNL
jgi:hypothetical protein